MPKLEEIYTAVASDDTERLKSYIDDQPELIRQRDHEGCTPLIIAARDGRYEAVRLLIDNGADLEARDPEYKRTPLAWAAFNAHREIVQLLAETGADVNALDAYGNLPLKTACMGSQGAWREWVPKQPHEYEAVADILKAYGATEKHG